MHLPDRRGRERLALELGEDLLRRRAELRVDHLLRCLGRERRRLCLELLQDLLELVLVTRRGEAIDVARHLTELERKALHLAERLEHRLGGLLRLDEDLRPLLLLLVLGPRMTRHPLANAGDRERDGLRAEHTE